MGFAKGLGLTLSENLTWNCHVEKIITKGNKRMFFIIQLEYSSPVFHHGLPKYLSDDIERVHKRAPKIISPSMSYTDNLTRLNLQSLKARREEHCRRLFSTVLSDQTHKLRALLPPVNNSHYNLRTRGGFSGSSPKQTVLITLFYLPCVTTFSLFNHRMHFGSSIYLYYYTFHFIEYCNLYIVYIICCN